MVDTGPNVPNLKGIREHPLVRELCELATHVGGVSLMVVHATGGHWKQTRICGKPGGSPEFCRLVQASEKGARECRLCHVLMTVAACSGSGAVVQRCHSGASTFIAPASPSSTDSLAVVSSCTFAEEGGWDAVRERGEALGIDLEALQRTYFALPRITSEQQQTLLRIMNALGHALNVLVENDVLKLRVQQPEAVAGQASLERFLRDTKWATIRQGGEGHGDAEPLPLLVRVARELVQQRPDLQLGVKELAGAARVTPNYFSTLFRAHAGESFVEYQTNVRMQRAQKLLRDVRLNVGDVARLVGYEDAGYFTRRFRQKTGVSPSVWRNQHAGPAGERAHD